MVVVVVVVRVVVCTLCTIFIINLCKKTAQIKMSFTATRPTSQQKSKRCYYFAAHCHNVNVLLSNSTFLIFVVSVV